MDYKEAYALLIVEVSKAIDEAEGAVAILKKVLEQVEEMYLAAEE